MFTVNAIAITAIVVSKYLLASQVFVHGTKHLNHLSKKKPVGTQSLSSFMKGE